MIHLLSYIYQVRGILAQLGYEKLDDIIGRTEILKRRDVQLAKTQSLDLSFLMAVSSSVSACITVNCKYIQLASFYRDLMTTPARSECFRKCQSHKNHYSQVSIMVVMF